MQAEANKNVNNIGSILSDADIWAGGKISVNPFQGRIAVLFRKPILDSCVH